MFSQSQAADLSPITCSREELAGLLQETLGRMVTDLLRVRVVVSARDAGGATLHRSVDSLREFAAMDWQVGEGVLIDVYAWKSGEFSVFLAIHLKAHPAGLELQVSCYDTLCEKSVFDRLVAAFPPKVAPAAEVVAAQAPAVAWPEAAPAPKSWDDAPPAAAAMPTAAAVEPSHGAVSSAAAAAPAESAAPAGVAPAPAPASAPIPAPSTPAQVAPSQASPGQPSAGPEKPEAVAAPAPLPKTEKPEAPADPEKPVAFRPLVAALLPLALVGIATFVCSLVFPEASAYAGQILDWPLLAAAAGLVLAGGFVLRFVRFRRAGHPGAVVRALGVALLAVAAVLLVGNHWVAKTFNSPGFAPWSGNIYYPVEGSTAEAWVRDEEKNLELRGSIAPEKRGAVVASDTSHAVSWGDYGLTPQQVHDAVIAEREHRLGLAHRHADLPEVARAQVHPFFLLHFLACFAVVFGAAGVFVLAWRPRGGAKKV